jgi:hypothetical protein
VITLQANKREYFLLFKNLLPGYTGFITYELEYYDTPQRETLDLYVEEHGNLLKLVVLHPGQLREGKAVLVASLYGAECYRDEVFVLEPAPTPAQ